MTNYKIDFNIDFREIYQFTYEAGFHNEAFIIDKFSSVELLSDVIHDIGLGFFKYNYDFNCDTYEILMHACLFLENAKKNKQL
jgi:hypothetical protein